MIIFSTHYTSLTSISVASTSSIPTADAGIISIGNITSFCWCFDIAMHINTWMINIPNERNARVVNAMSNKSLILIDFFPLLTDTGGP